jgi:thiamine monophosphate synthase
MRLKHYIFTEKLTPNLEKKSKFVNIIYNSNFEDKDKFINFLNLNYYCKKKKIPIFVLNNAKIAIKYKLNGIFLTSDNKRFTLTPHIKKKFKIIGSCHNQMEFFTKYHQGCGKVTLSPLFFNIKYSKTKILGPIKFNLISLNWKIKLCALGGINDNNFKKVQLTKSRSIGYKI